MAQTTKTLWTEIDVRHSENGARLVPVGLFEKETTALRLAKQRNDPQVRAVEAVRIDGAWYLPLSAVEVVSPSREDNEKQDALDKKRAAFRRAKELGLSDAEIASLRFREDL